MQVLLDGKDIRELPLGWLRQQMGLVAQEPVLFGSTIADNIRQGREGASQADVEAAAEAASVHGFITTLPLGYDTRVRGLCPWLPILGPPFSQQWLLDTTPVNAPGRRYLRAPDGGDATPPCAEDSGGADAWTARCAASRFWVAEVSTPRQLAATRALLL